MADPTPRVTSARPLLAFGAPTVGAASTRQSGPPPRGPGASRQGERLTPQFRTLRDAMSAARATFATETPERDPEMVVVFDLAGTVDQFARAVRLVPGLEFLAELAEDDAEPDEDFHRLDRNGRITNRAVPETLYMVMSDARAVDELISLFGRWQADPQAPLPTGLYPFKVVFGLLRSVRRWGPQDRIRETGLLEMWEEEKEVVGQSRTTRQVEIELWFRSDEGQRSTAQAEVERVVTDSGGTVVTTATLPDIAYHAVLADIPFTQIETVLQHGPDSIALLRTDTIMLVSPARPMTIPAVEIADSGTVGTVAALPVDAPRVALLDGLPLANHVQLAGRLVIDDPDDHSSRYTVAQRQHGTAMASLICHGDLNSRGRPLSTRLYVRPILEPHPTNDRAETTARGQLLVDLVHRAFHRMFEGDGQHPPAAPSVRIVNLSIGDPLRTFARHLSPLARLLDWLAHKYNLVILVSAGNHDVVPTVPTQAVHDGTELPESVAADVYSRARLHRLLSPAEAVNVITVGALHTDGATGWASGTVVDGGKEAMPAPYSAVGFGHRRSVKPEILLPGGRQLFQRPLPTSDNEVTLRPAQHFARGPGMRVAAPGVGGEVARATAFLSGTSNAAALASRLTNEIMDALETYKAEDGEFRFPDAQYHPVLAKTLLVHAASWGDIEPWLADALDLPRRTARRDITQLLGYGAVDLDRVATANRTRAVLIGAATIRDRERHTFAFPLPPSLAATTDWRRLTITMGWLSPINARTLRHRIARLRFDPPQSEIGVKRSQADSNAAVNGTVQHEILEGTAAVAYAAGASLSITVDARIDGAPPAAGVRYGIAASIELAANAQADVHEEVRQALRVLVRQRQHVRADIGSDRP